MSRSWLLVPAFALFACGSPAKKPSPPMVTEEQAAALRASCTFAAGTMPAKTLATDDPVGDQIPINHIVLIMQENRSFDAYYSNLTVPGQTVSVASPTATNPDADGGLISRFHWSASTASNGNPNGKDYYCFADTDHGWDQSHSEYDDGKLDGFVTTNNDDGDGRRAMGYYDQSDLPYYYALSQSFAISDANFCSLLGPTWPNRMFYFAATSFGLTYNILPPTNKPNGDPYPNLFTELAAAGVSWKVYFVDVASPIIFANVWGDYPQNFVPIQQYTTDAQNDQLPAVSIVEASDSGKGEIIDEHPPQNMQVGAAWAASAINTLMASPEWPTSALFLTYDEHGGEYDHVVPPPACPPDDLPTLLSQQQGATVDAGFDTYGFRTPLIVVSPYAKRGYVSHVVVDHTSVLKFVETRFNLPSMTGRDANAWPLLDMFDFSHADTSVPTLPTQPVDPTQQAQCLMDYPPSKSGF